MTPTTQRRITFLSVFDTLEGDYDASLETVDRLDEDGFFAEGKSPSRSSGRSERSGGRGSGGRKSGGRGRGRDQQQMRDPDGPPTEKQVGKVMFESDDYDEDALYDMSKQEVSDIIEDLVG